MEAEGKPPSSPHAGATSYGNKWRDTERRVLLVLDKSATRVYRTPNSSRDASPGAAAPALCPLLGTLGKAPQGRDEVADVSQAKQACSEGESCH